MSKIDKTKTVIGWVDKPNGMWVRKEDMQTHWYECSECGGKPPCNRFGLEYYSNYCPKCGAKMAVENE